MAATVGAGTPGRRSWRFWHSRTRLAVTVAVAVAAAVVIGAGWAWRYAPVLGWDLGAAVFVSWTWIAITPMDAAATAAHATREDPTRGVSDLIVLAAALASLAAVFVLLFGAESAHGDTRGTLAVFGLVSVAMSWLTVHTLFTLRYALLYYSGTDGGIDFNQSEPPRYTDFAYLAFTLGMTFQVSDTDLQDHAVRVTALRHALLSYVFGSVILAATINLVVSLTGSG